MKRYADELAGIELDKSDLLRRGDWEAEELSPSMVNSYGIYRSRDSSLARASGSRSKDTGL